MVTVPKLRSSKFLISYVGSGFQKDLKTTGQHEKGIRNQCKRSVRDEATWVVTNLYTKAMLGISV
jgi:hypothetical protein